MRPRGKTDDIASCGLTFSELQELWLGPCNGGSVFTTTEELRDAWARGRAVVMRLWGSGGRRPQGWWHLDPEAEGLCYPGYDCERSYLYEHGVLSPQECDALEREWRAAFAEALAMQEGPERRAHYRHHDIPNTLIKRWSARRRRAKAAVEQRSVAQPPAEEASIK